MAMANHPTTVARWNTRFSDDTAPLITRELDYVLDADDPVAVAARANVLILPANPVVAAVADRSGLDYNETAGILDGFMAALDRAEGGAA